VSKYTSAKKAPNKKERQLMPVIFSKSVAVALKNPVKTVV
jgi:hypothetical protein